MAALLINCSDLHSYSQNFKINTNLMKTRLPKIMTRLERSVPFSTSPDASEVWKSQEPLTTIHLFVIWVLWIPLTSNKCVNVCSIKTSHTSKLTRRVAATYRQWTHNHRMPFNKHLTNRLSEGHCFFNFFFTVMLLGYLNHLV